MRIELWRKFIHFFFGNLFLVMVIFLGVQLTLPIIVVSLVFGFTVSYLLKKGYYIPFFSYMVEKTARDYEKHLPGRGALLFFLGAVITMALFQEASIVLPAIIVVVYGDAAATLVGKKLGKIKTVAGKSLEGTLAGIAAAFFVLSFFMHPFAGLALSVIGMLAELIPGEDNVVIPVVCGAALKFLF